MVTPLERSRGAGDRIGLLLFATLIASLLVTSLWLQHMSTRAAALADDLSQEAMPALEHIASLHDATVDLQLALAELVHVDGRDRGPIGDAKARLAELEERVRRVTSTGLSSDGTRLLARFEQAVRQTMAVAHDDMHRARDIFHEEVRAAADALEHWEMSTIAANARQGQAAARELQRVRQNVIWLACSGGVLVLLAAATGVITLRRRAARRLAALGAYARDQETRARDGEVRAAEMEEFAGRVAHDIRSPLSTASLAAELLREHIVDDTARDHVARLERSLKRAASITEGLLEFARAGAHPEPGARTDVRETIHDIADGLTAELVRARIELDVGAIPAVHVPCSPGVFVSVLGNLVRNAMKYMGEREPRRIAIRATDRGSALRIEISDSGPGIGEGALPKLFEPYFQVARGSQAGLGLGLPTVRKLVEGHGGRVGVQSIVGQGSTFWFELPYAPQLAHARLVRA